MHRAKELGVPPFSDLTVELFEQAEVTYALGIFKTSSLADGADEDVWDWDWIADHFKPVPMG